MDNFASGCVFAELCSGEYLLPGLREEEHLKAIEIVMGECIPQVLFRTYVLVLKTSVMACLRVPTGAVSVHACNASI